MRPRLVLASQSPRRREILERAGFRFEVRVTGVPEVRAPEETASEYVQRLAASKAHAGAVPGEDGAVVLGADTVVVLDNHILEKPVDEADARRMLGVLSGREHRVITGICLAAASGSVIIHDQSETRVRFAQVSQAEIDTYIESGEALDKAGAYAIQGLASKFIERIEGCYFNVVGLPVSLVWRHLKQLGITAELF